MVGFELIFKPHGVVRYFAVILYLYFHSLCGKIPEVRTPFPLDLVSPWVSVRRSVLSDSGDEERFNQFVKFRCLLSFSGNILDVQHRCAFSCQSFAPLQTLSLYFQTRIPSAKLEQFRLFETKNTTKSWAAFKGHSPVQPSVLDSRRTNFQAKTSGPTLPHCGVRGIAEAYSAENNRATSQKVTTRSLNEFIRAFLVRSQTLVIERNLINLFGWWGPRLFSYVHFPICLISRPPLWICNLVAGENRVFAPLPRL